MNRSGLWNSCLLFADRLKRQATRGFSQSSTDTDKKRSGTGTTWWILNGSDKVGELRDGQRDPDSEFWMEYQLIVEDIAFEQIQSDADRWYDLGLTLQNADNPNNQMTDFLVATREPGKVAIRYLY